MPSRIDRGARFDRITEATARVVAAEGVAAASLRRVAAEAGLPLHALRHLCPDTGTLHQRTVKWLRRKLAEDQHVVYPDPDDLADIVRRTLRALMPSGDEALMRARAWAAFRHAAAPDSLVAGIIEREEREALTSLARLVDGVRRRAEKTPRPSRVIYAQDYVPPTPDSVDASTLHVLALTAGLASLVAEHRVPLGSAALDRWLQHLELRHLDLPA